MAKPRPEEKIPEKKEPSELRILPMNLQVGDRLTDETGEYEVIGRPYTTNAGKDGSRARPGNLTALKCPGRKASRVEMIHVGGHVRAASRSIDLHLNLHIVAFDFLRTHRAEMMPASRATDHAPQP
jgi:hypothetical protein